jgi:hypothetical protein
MVKWLRRNADVIRAWAEGREGRVKNLRSEGGSLFSFNQEIGRTVEGKRYLLKTEISITTKRHTNMAKRYADGEVFPNHQNVYQRGGHKSWNDKWEWPDVIAYSPEDDSVIYGGRSTFGNHWRLIKVHLADTFRQLDLHDFSTQAYSASVWGAFKKLVERTTDAVTT